MPKRSHRRRITAAAVSAATALSLALALALALALTGTLPASATQTRAADPVQRGLDRLVHEDGYPAALAAATGRDGRTRDAAAGVADLRTGAKAPVDGQVRAASVTKTFTAAVVLQLVGEGKVALDAPVETYLPGLLRGDGIDGRRITVRQLLQHTSGLPDYTPYMADLTSNRHRYHQPRTLLDLALRHKAGFPPGKGWRYCNTDYVVAGLLIEQVTGRPAGEEITRRVIDRAGLRHTSFPAAGDQRIRGAHPHGYVSPKPGAPLLDVTEMDPSAAWTGGALISTPRDLNRFFGALLGGRLLKPAQLAQMRTTVAIPADAGYPKGTRFGLGLSSQPLSCGGLLWGHDGDFLGYATDSAATDDGRAATIAVTAAPAPAEQGRRHAAQLLDTALCG
ncbi:serine hydrolase [Streptomyces sp. CB02923]|uniref:serine hydrolase domain-containing protein n=1 Tax=Streptomyces sp. CB02923 TaxID=1718985 RepID=UPI00093F61C4|nr:serine hydrolase domain-containing protein [Streptomyces sp. CB02923]OKI04996.1 serine hydrolase [Streptomyces sp. CB02923]